MKSPTTRPSRLLEPLSIPNHVWEDLSLNFIVALPISSGKNDILVVIDRLSKGAHFIAMANPLSSLSVARAFSEHVVKLHGIHGTLDSDRDWIFISSIWKDLFHLQGMTLKHLSTYHLQSDGQTEVINQCLQ